MYSNDLLRKRKNPCVKEGISYQELEGEIVLFNKDRKKVFKLNQVASLIFFFCDGEHFEQDILDELAKVFIEVKPSVLAADLTATLYNFKKEGIVY